jgi:hypothetical protein
MTRSGETNRANRTSPRNPCSVRLSASIRIAAHLRQSTSAAGCRHAIAADRRLDQTVCLSRLAVAERRMLMTLPGLTLNVRAVDLSPAP